MRELSNLEPFISSERAYTYYQKSINSEKALNLYIWNTDISYELLKIISSFEVYLRNSVFKIIEHSSKDGLFDITFLGSLKEEDRNKIIGVVKSKDKSVKFNFNKPISRSNPIPILKSRYKGKVVSELNFFFWESALSNRILCSLDSEILKIGFPNIPSDKTYEDLISLSKNVRFVRNRICHNEHLLNQDIPSIINDIYTLIGYISNDLVDFEKEKEKVSYFLNLI